jgi:hypothetical protein
VEFSHSLTLFQHVVRLKLHANSTPWHRPPLTLANAAIRGLQRSIGSAKSRPSLLIITHPSPPREPTLPGYHSKARSQNVGIRWSSYKLPQHKYGWEPYALNGQSLALRGLSGSFLFLGLSFYIASLVKRLSQCARIPEQASWLPLLLPLHDIAMQLRQSTSAGTHRMRRLSTI